MPDGSSPLTSAYTEENESEEKGVTLSTAQTPATTPTSAPPDIDVSLDGEEVGVRRGIGRGRVVSLCSLLKIAWMVHFRPSLFVEPLSMTSDNLVLASSAALSDRRLSSIIVR